MGTGGEVTPAVGYQPGQESLRIIAGPRESESSAWLHSIHDTAVMTSGTLMTPLKVRSPLGKDCAWPRGSCVTIFTYDQEIREETPSRALSPGDGLLGCHSAGQHSEVALVLRNPV